MKESLKNLFTSLWLHKHSRPISNSSQLCSDQWNRLQGFLTKFGHEVITGINTHFKMCPGWFHSYELKTTEWMKMRDGIIIIIVSLWVEMNSCGFIFLSLHTWRSSKWTEVAFQNELKAVWIHFALVGNVYIPKHDLFSDIPVSWKHRGCLVHIIWSKKQK